MISLMAVFAVITAYWAKYYHLTHDRRTLEKSYAFSRFGPFCKISKVFPQTIFAAVRVPLNYLLMQYFFYLKNQIQFHPIANMFPLAIEL
jgi:hypothetical protein